MAVSTGLRRIEQPAGQPLHFAFAQVQPQRWADSLASLVSAVLSPPVLAAAMIAVAATASRLAAAWPWAGLGLALSVVAPIGYLLWLYQRGLVSDLDVQRREERPRPLVFTLAALALSATLFWLSPAPPLLRGLAAAHFAQTTLVLAITLRWKISMHGAASAACGALLLYVAGPHAALALLAVPLVAWSRIRLHRHTPAQTLAGAVLGGFVTWSVLVWTAVI
jgi:membrane-associated phospholipid phosphatase